MDLTFTDAERAFRDELREWLREHAPEARPRGGEEDGFAWRRDWQRTLHADGWAAVHWPREHGGRGASVTQSAIFFEEIARAGAPLPANVLGILLTGPTVMTWGTQEQQDRYLGPILSADEIWCQGFSEPGAGSDLAAVQTRAVRDDSGDGWLVTGQKVWTSAAQFSQRCMLVARTDPDAAKHKGLTYFLLEMDQPGVEVRPLKQITGGTEFNEVFLDGARVSDDDVLGGVGNGWKVALTTLMNERAGLAFFLQVALRQSLDGLVAQLGARGALDDPRTRDRLADLHARCEVLRLTAYRGLSRLEHEGQPGPEGSLTKLMWSRCNQDLVQLAADTIGPEALQWDSPWSYELLRARGNTIEGGTTEILKNIVAERVLGLPRAR